MVSICRLCASLKKTTNMTFIREPNHDLSLKLVKCCQLCIDLNDALPKGVCPDCIRQLNSSFEFYERVHESQQSLGKLLNIPSAEASETDGEIQTDDVHEKESLAMMAAAAANENSNSPPKATSEQEINDNESATEDELRDQIKEILEVKEDFFDSETEGGQKRDIEEVTMMAPYAGIEFIDEAAEDADFDGNLYDIIDVEEETEEVMEIVSIEDQEEEYELIDNQTSVAEMRQSSANITDEMTYQNWDDMQWKCEGCLESFNLARNLLEHNKKAHQADITDMKWSCIDCQKQFERYYSLINHVRQRHHPQLALMCDICNLNCEGCAELAQHRRSEHEDEADFVMVVCDECGKGFSTINSLQIHKKCHLPEEERLRYPCHLCDKKFRTSSNLKFHLKMHNGTRDYVCHICGKKFTQKSNLDEHQVTHLTSTPYECSVCQKSFKTPDRLARHKQRHNDDKPYSCSYCPNTFRTKDAMNTHLRIHTGEMPFKCEFCSKPFRFRSTLMTHHNVHTGTKPYSCLDCDHHFTNWPNYNKHMKRRHGIDASSKNPRGKKPGIPRQPAPRTKRHPTASKKSVSPVKVEASEEILGEEFDELIADDDAHYETITGAN